MTKASELYSNKGISSPGVKLHGSGFIIKPSEATHLGLGNQEGIENYIKKYRNGNDIIGSSRNVMVIDLFGLTVDQVRVRYPKVYQHVLQTVRPKRNENNRDSYKENWWVFGEPRKELRPALEELSRYIATVETTNTRIFQFLDIDILPDNMLICIALDDGFSLGVLSSGLHKTWAIAQGGTLGSGPRYNKSVCFDNFPFPDASDNQKAIIAQIAEDLDAHRKRVVQDHPHLTMTKLYNVLELIKSGKALDALSKEDRRVYEDGLVLILKDYHDRLDQAVLSAYGWEDQPCEVTILERLVALNKQRSIAEANGEVKWLRPEFQIPRFAKSHKLKDSELDLGDQVDLNAKPSFPKERMEQPLAVKQLLQRHGAMSEDNVIRAFSNGNNKSNRMRILKVIETLDRYGEIIIEDGKIIATRAA